VITPAMILRSSYAILSHVIFMLCLIPATLFAQADGEITTIFDMLHQKERVVRIELAFNFEEIEINRRSEERFDALMRFVDGNGRPQLWEVELNVRGRYRRLHCNFPPLKLNFDKDDLRALNLETHNNLKLVTHCLKAPVGEEYVLREFLVYQLYEELTDISYRTQLVEITYLDTHSDARMTKYGIILEDEKELAARFESELCEDCFGTEQASYDQEAVRVQDLFQYMVGNADWSPKILRNVKLLKPTDGSPYLLVPYDFDYTGFVNAVYVSVPPHLGVDNIRDRVYLGFPHSTEELAETFKFFQANREQLFATIDNFPFLTRKARKDLRDYVRGFFIKYRNRSELDTLAANPKNIIGRN